MNAEIVCIGTELLLGHIVNTNTSFLSQKLAEAGIDVYHHIAVGDNHSRLAAAFRQALSRADIVVTSGGLGPTVDDITTETLASFIGQKLVLNKTILGDVKEYFRSKKVKFPKESIRQAYIPQGVKWIRNKVGTAPGIIAEYKGKVIICLPGPPREIEPMFTKDIIPYLKRKHISGRAHLSVPYYGPWTLKTRTIKTTGLAESQVDGKVRDLLNLKPPTTVGIYAKLGQADLKIMSKARSDRQANIAISKVEKKIRSRLKDYIFGCDDETLEGTVGKLLAAKKKTIAIAESCTGGLVSNRITNVSGSSKYFKMGLVTYSNETKENILGVSRDSLRKYGAVSKQVALEMAAGIKLLACVDIAVAITGIAGPTGGTKSKPVGLVYIALFTGKKQIVKEFYFKGSREEIKFQASQVVLDLVRKNA